MKIFGILAIIVVVVAALYGLNKARNVNQHYSKPKTDKNPEFDTEELITGIKNSEYYKNLQSLNDFVSGQMVRNSITGNSGFILVLENGTWVSAYRENNSVGSSFGKSQPAEEIIRLINNDKYGNASEPIPQNTIYANQVCDIPREVFQSHGKRIEGLSYGASSFNFAFENGFELDVKLVDDKDGKPSFRVFWEQW
jgi:hypothetical protein